MTIAYADSLNREQFTSNLSQNTSLFSQKKFEKSIDFAKSNWQIGSQQDVKIPTEKQLIKISIRLRDIARYLGTDLPIISVINDDFQNEKIKGRIIEFKNQEGNWTPITVGHILNMVSQEIQILKESGKQPLFDFLIKEEASNRYQPILGIPLNYYCQKLLDYVEIRPGKKYNLL